MTGRTYGTHHKIERPWGYLTTPELAARTGISYRMLHYWATHGNIPSVGSQGSGTRRYHSPDQIEPLRRLARARRLIGLNATGPGLTFEQLGRVADLIDENQNLRRRVADAEIFTKRYR